MKKGTSNIVFRCDGNSEIGMGHVYRCLALAEMLKEKFTCKFVTCFFTPNLKQILDDAYESVVLLPSFESHEKDFLESLDGNEIVVLDNYYFSSDFQQKIKLRGSLLVCIDDLADRYFYSDILINHAPGVSEQEYQGQSDMIFALGTSYALLRPGFLAAAKIKDRNLNLSSVFICFGGADPKDFTHQIVNFLLQLSNIESIHIVLGANYLHKEIYGLAVHHEKINIHSDLTEAELISVMELCGIGIIPSSTILFELCAVKMLILSGYYTDNQTRIYKGFKEKNVFIDLGNLNELTFDKFEQIFLELGKKKDVSGYTNNQENLIDGESRNRIINLFENRCSK